MASLADQEEETNNSSYAMELASAIVLPAVMQAVVELDVFEIISKAGPVAKLSVAEIVAQIPLKDNNPEAAARHDPYNALSLLFCLDGTKALLSCPCSAYLFANNQKRGSLSPYMALCLDKEEETNNFSHAMGLASAIVLPAVMQAVVELDVFEIISKAGPGAKLSVAEIVAQIPLKDNNPEAAAMMLDRVLRLLVSYNALHCSFVDGQRLYSLAPVSKHFVRNNRDGVSLRPYMALFGLKKQILEGGIAFNKAHGMQIYDYLGVDSRFNDVFNNGMLSHTSIVMEKVLESYKGFEHVKKLVDVGGGLGITLNMIISKYPHIKGINYDLPYVIKDAPSYPGIEHIGGDLFESIPEADTIFMKWMLHSFDDEQALKVLKNCYKALPDGGKLLNINSTISEMPGNNAASREISILDTVLLVQLPHGRERTKQEYTELAVKAGFKGVNYDYGVCNLYVMEFFK
ncbi:hypothetical protein CUMW_114610 [Citrus unshiu]|nr:hypothetical protein CUMW_114610 [Citrus unshiu]